MTEQPQGAVPPPLPPGAPAPPPPRAPAPPAASYAAPPKRRGPARIVGGVAAFVVVIAIKLFAVFGVGHLLHGRSAPIIIVILIAAGILVRFVTRFLRL